MEGGLDIRAWCLDDGLCCLTDDTAIQLHQEDVALSHRGHHCSATAGIQL